MRDIKFRGQRLDGKGWVYGNLVYSNDIGLGAEYVSDAEILNEDGITSIWPVTIGQFTGLTDKNWKDIYEDMELIGGKESQIVKVEWDVKCGRWAALGDDYRVLGHRFDQFEINEK